jgi:peptide/nickel transport system substrate-binding protein
VDALLEEGRNSTDDADRLAAYAEAQEIIWEESPCVFVQHDTEVTAYSAALQGFNVSPEGYFRFNLMSF